LQLALGGVAYWAVESAKNTAQPTPTYVILTVVHVAVGALTFAASVFLTLRCFRMFAPSHAPVALETPRERAIS
jgi:hypothetical protein